MIKFIAPSFVIISCLMHLFCCGIPLLLSVTSVTAMLGISSVSFFELEWLEAIEQELIIASGVVLFATIAAHIISKRLNCHGDAGCCDEPCDSKKSFVNRLLWFAGGLYLFNMVTLLIT